jgi:ElaB/YqjD/DUF883 family membrane-anchored ribosome-binding protein
MKPKNFSQALDELEDLTRTTGSDLKRKIQEELHDLEDKIHKLKPQLDELKGRARDEAYKAKDRVESQVKDNPWAAIGIVGLIFFVLGFLLAGRRGRD